MTITERGPGTTVAHIDDLPLGSLRLVRVDGRRLCLVRTSEGVHAIDNTCPHEGYGLTQGSLDGELLTCAWHNWKFRVSDGACVQGEEDVRSHHVRVDPAGNVVVHLVQPPPAEERRRLHASLGRAIERSYVGQMSRDVVRLLQASADPGELIWQAVAYGAPRAEFGWGHSIASATDCLALTELYDGDERALPIVQAIAGIAEQQRGYPVKPLPVPAGSLPPGAGAAFRAAIEAEHIEKSQALVLAAIEAGLDRAELHRWFTGAVSDHHLSYGHGSIYTQKAFQLLDLIGWERASTVLPYLVPALVYGTREDLLPYMRPFMRALATVDLDRLADRATDPGWADDGRLRAALLGPDRAAPVAAARAALEEGAGVDGVLDVVVDAVSERMLRYDTANERIFEDDFGWLDITHGLTYANSVRFHHRHHPGPDTVRLALFCAFLAQWTGRHEWHTAVGPAAEIEMAAPLAEAAIELQRRALTDETSTFIVHAHAVKTSRAAAEEAERTGSDRPLAATTRFLDGPRLERFVAANVVRSIDFVAGRVRRPASD